MFLPILTLLINICSSLFLFCIGLRCHNLSILMALFGALGLLGSGIVLIIGDEISIWVYENIISLPQFEFELSFILDNFTGCFFVLIGLITFAILIFGLQYLETEADINRFIPYINLFALSMVLLVSAGSIIQLFVGWEGVGIMSFLLVNFWFKRLQANRAGLKAVLYNRIGDVGLFIALVGFMVYIHSLDITIINNVLIQFSPILVNFFLLGISLAAFAKSAQYGFHSWLLEAMEGPTPVSALLHSATMVTAGVFLNLRFGTIFTTNFWITKLSIYIGLLTLCFGSLAALVKRDVKKLTAFSSVSQLGILMIGNMSFNFASTFIHLETHALFKSLLFIIMGLILMQLSLHDQDSRIISAINRNSLFISTLSVISTGALMGLPFLAGFYSKELILQGLILNDYILVFCCVILLFASLLTCLYCSFFLLIEFISARNNRNGGRLLSFVTPISFFIIVIGYGLAFGSLISGFFLEEFGFILADSIIFSLLVIDVCIEKLAVLFTLCFFMWILANGTLINYSSFASLAKHPLQKRGEVLLGNEAYVLLWKRFLTFSFLHNSYIGLIKAIDRGILEKLGPFGICGIFVLFYNTNKSLQNGNMRYYLLYFVPFFFLIGNISWLYISIIIAIFLTIQLFFWKNSIN